MNDEVNVKIFFKRFMWTSVALIGLIIVGTVFVNYYSYIFARDVEGRVERVEKPNSPLTVVGGSQAGTQLAQQQMFSYAVAIREKSGEIVTASTEDRQWAAVETGKCAVAKFFPYPPWQLDKAGTYHQARLLKLYDCAP